MEYDNTTYSVNHKCIGVYIRSMYHWHIFNKYGHFVAVWSILRALIPHKSFEYNVCWHE